MPNDPIILLPTPRRLGRFAGECTLATERSSVDSTLTRPQGYRLTISPHQIEIIGHDPAGLFYARQTLAQLRHQFGRSLPCLIIEDSPDFPVRGVMLDVSRDKVPTMATLLNLIDLLASWKINQLQLYIEHTFAYRGHEEVWKNASPFTPDEIRQIDAFCKDRFIDLVPNQNSFGHMERWLKHAKYTPLAESIDGAPMPSGSYWKGPFSLCPTDPHSLDLLGDLYSQFLPNYSSKLFNVGCDETFDLGHGRSKQECDERGKTTVYLDFLSRVQKLVDTHGRRMMFWGDIILHDPQSIPKLPKNVIALNWGYEADHPFDAEAKLFAKSGIPFYVCPGTSSWCSIAGRTDNMLQNQINAAAAGLKHGAIGYLNTDWGDYGHLQYLPVSYPGLAAGAAMSWCLDSNRDLSLPDSLDLHAFADSANVMGKLACDLGNVYHAIGKLVKNRSALFNLMVPSSVHDDPRKGITRAKAVAAVAAIKRVILPLKQSKMDRPDAQLIRDEYANAAAMLFLACRRRWSARKTTTEDMEQIIREHRRLWLARNRPGGLEDSIGRLLE